MVHSVKVSNQGAVYFYKCPIPQCLRNKGDTAAVQVFLSSQQITTHKKQSKIIYTSIYYLMHFLMCANVNYHALLSTNTKICLNIMLRYDWGLLLGRGDNLQLFISPLLKYEGWLYNIIDDKNFEINSLEPPCTGDLKTPHTPMGTCRNAKNENFEFCFDCGKNVFQWTKKNHLGHFDWNCLGSRYPIRPNT